MTLILKNKKKKRVRKVLIILSLVVIIIASIIGGGSLAYKTYQGDTYNKVTTSGLSVKLWNLASDGTSMSLYINEIQPWKTVENRVFAENDGAETEFLRMKINLVVTKSDGTKEVFNYITFSFNESDWTYRNGYYYYNSAVAPGGNTTNLYDQIYFPYFPLENYQEASLHIEITVEAVQYANNSDSALTAEGWEEVLNG